MSGLVLAALIAAPLFTGICIILNIMEGSGWNGTQHHGR